MDTGLNGSAAGCPRRSRRGRDPRRTPRRRGRRPSARTRAPARAGPRPSGCPPTRATNSPRSGVPVRGLGIEVGLGESLGRRMREGEEGRPVVLRVAGPPADRDQLRVARRYAVMKSSPGGSAGFPLKNRDRQIERPPPGVDRRRAPAERRAELREHQVGLSRSREVRRDLVGVVGAVLAILVQRDRPGDLLGLRVDLDLAGQAGRPPPGRSRVTSATGPIRCKRDPRLPPIGVLDERLMCPEVEAGDDRARAIRCRQGVRLPAAWGEPEGGVLKLRLGRSQLDRELPEDLGVGVERVAGLAPGLV